MKKEKRYCEVLINLMLEASCGLNSKSKEFAFNAAYENILHQNPHLTYYEIFLYNNYEYK